MPTDPPPPSLLHSVDWLVVAYAFGMATLMSVLTTLRARNLQQIAGQPIPSWGAIVPDTLLGGVIGFMAAVIAPEVVKSLHTFAGVTLVAGVGGTLGPKLTDWIGSNGLDVLLDWLGSRAGGLASSIRKRQEGRDDDSKDQNGPAREAQ
ncbi:hypothetical protein [Deinococcus enclensis]|uniref:Uncharacterized protein n=1 Tax=Deinococcus enclensis TaxID=1049582 RepID=A0ABT9MB62_9DEIO|nr:hypothetical protein [Deinococcus enclensis]MDP9763830.1 hypothetical protein [Deinococcus enclensis]